MRKIIVLNNQLQLSGAMNLNYAFWLSVPTNIITTNPSGTSVVPDAGTAEIAAIQSGSVQEQVLSTSLPANFTQGAVGSYLINQYNQAQTFLTNCGTVKNYASTYWDGVSWFNVPA